VKYARDWRILEADVSTINFSQFPDVDLVSGGPPCQPFSQGGKRRGHTDPREMFPQFIRAIRELHPKAFIIENVKGLTGPKFIDYFAYLVHQLRFPDALKGSTEHWTKHRSRLERIYTADKYQDFHYKVIWQSLNAADFGVGQRRDRVFIVGIRADLGIEYSFPSGTHAREALWFDQWITGEYWDRHHISKRLRPEPPNPLRTCFEKLTERPSSSPWKTVRDVISDLPYVGIGHTSRRVLNHFLNPGARTYEGHNGSHLDFPAKTIKAGQNGVPGGENIIRLDDGSVRYFSVRECARLQSFPDNWAFEGSWSSCMRQIGNAVPVTLSEMVGAPLATALRALSISRSQNSLQAD
jgi:DNA (cytosine-5)-methyltransferase 1